MLIRTKLALNLAVQLGLVVVLSASMLSLCRSFDSLEQAQRCEQESQGLVAELRQSSDELTIMARQFVLTREPRFSDYFNEIMAIRDGAAPRPDAYDLSYWDRVRANPAQHAVGHRHVALLDILRRDAFLPEEFALLSEAKRRSDALVQHEELAMNLVRGDGVRAVTDADRQRALELLHGEDYLRAKAGIMEPLATFVKQVDARVRRQREEAHRQEQRATRWMIAAMAVLALQALISALSFDRSVRLPVGKLRSWAQTVRAGRMGSRTRLQDNSEFGELSGVIDEMTDSVERSLSELREEVVRRTRAEEAVRHLANHDGLTGLPSLRLVHDRLDRALAHARRHEQGLAVMFGDLNDFKPVNDRYGHECGDLVLKTVAQRLASGLREVDTVGRIGGDEFLLVLPDVSTMAAAEQVRDKLAELVAEPIYLPSRQLSVQVGVALGIALFPSMGDDIDTLVRLADEDMYRIKQARSKTPAL